MILSRHTDSDQVNQFLRAWIVNHECPKKRDRSPITKTFKSTIHSLGKSNLDPLADIVTDWFCSNETKLHRAASDIVESLITSNIKNQQLNFQLTSETVSAMSEDDVVFTVKKILGYIQDGKMLSSLVFSIVHSNHKLEFVNQLVTWAFRVWIGYNYPKSAYEYLEMQLESGTPTAKNVAGNCKAVLDQYYDPLDELPRLKEFQPPRSRGRRYARIVHKMSKHYENKASEESVLSKLFTTVPIKAGKTWAIKVNGETKKQKMTRSDFEIEIPRGEIYDPVGQHHKRLIWRHTLRVEN